MDSATRKTTGNDVFMTKKYLETYFGGVFVLLRPPTKYPTFILEYKFVNQTIACFKAVIDARSLLAELNSSARKDNRQSNLSAASGSPIKKDYSGVYSSIVSAQSSARPGVVIDLDRIEDTQQNWQNTILLHTFHYEMVHGSVTSPSRQVGGSARLSSTYPSSMADIRSKVGFKEVFYVVLAERVGNTTLMHMWQLTLESPEMEEETKMSATSSRSQTPDDATGSRPEDRRVVVSSWKVCSQQLPLPPNVSVIQCVPAAGHLSSSSIYPACLAPYLLITACSDNTIR